MNSFFSFLQKLSPQEDVHLHGNTAQSSMQSRFFTEERDERDRRPMMTKSWYVLERERRSTRV